MQKTNNFIYVLKIFLPLLLICALISGVVSGINFLTKDKIKENEAFVEAAKFEKKKEIINEIYDSITYDDFSHVEAEKLPEGFDEIIYTIDANGDKIAAATLTVKGYSKGLQVFVAYGSMGEILRVKIMASNETTGIGSQVSDEKHLGGYEGKQGIVDFADDKEDNLDKIAGATISSKAVLGAVNKATEALLELDLIEITEKGANQ